MRPSPSPLLSLLLSALLSGIAVPLFAAAEDATASVLQAEQVDAFWGRVKSADSAALGRLGAWRSTVEGYIPAADLKVASYEDIRPLFDAAADAKLGSMVFFTDPAWRRAHDAVLLSQDVLDQIVRDYDIHPFFLTKVQDSDDLTVRVQWLILGNSQLLVGYDRAGTVYNPDYAFATGNYEYMKFHRLRIGVDDHGHQGFFDIKGANRVGDALSWMVGPMNADVKSAVVVRGQLRCSYTKFLVDGTRMVALLPIEKRPPAAADPTESK